MIDIYIYIHNIPEASPILTSKNTCGFAMFKCLVLKYASTRGNQTQTKSKVGWKLEVGSGSRPKEKRENFNNFKLFK